MASKTPKQSQLEMLLSEIQSLRGEVASLKTQQQQPVGAVTVTVAKKRGQPRADVYYVLVGVPSKDLPPQAIVCAKVLATAADVNHIPESEAMALIEAAKQSGRLRTTQDSWRIFGYYRPQLIEKNFLLMQTVA